MRTHILASVLGGYVGVWTWFVRSNKLIALLFFCCCCCCVFLLWCCRFLQKPPEAKQSPTRAILKGWVGAEDEFTSLWAGLGQALSVVEGIVGGTEPDRFGALLRGYLVYLHLTDESLEHYAGN